MAKEEKVELTMKQLGFEPKEGRAIVVKYQSENLSGKIANFFSNKFYVLQICENELVLAPFTNSVTIDIEKDEVLVLPLSEIERVSIKESALNYVIDIETADSSLLLTVQQKELSDWRMSGYYAGIATSVFKMENWHAANLDETLNELREIKK
ncbi:hypothetical protein [Vagococcus acidifermentans]|uniref:Uncharacterized protein n=1 Tax=Vagococcus acidifermentans TaxID=564710 RepID=A0A430B2P7_9ENTE|nr:hypothetical protein [Vagococcus acidifermentans]RSU14579.1 hypothetical protein CBF27_00935 [Vagococcus acidifermentans]